MQPIQAPDLTFAREHRHLFTDIQRGIEKESLRINNDGTLSLKPHPRVWGAPLTHPHITTDYSEALPEFITSPHATMQGALDELMAIHQYCYHHLDDEMLWVTSMPCLMGDEEQIPIARYGTSHSARMKEIYRMGLGYRYGRLMQTIAGVHYNFSLPMAFWKIWHQETFSHQTLQDFISEKYMGLIRNYLRYSWLIPYFYGASPAICQSFLKGKNVELEELTPGTRFGRYATSLRMSDLGYQNKVKSQLNISYNSLREYIGGLENAIRTPDPLYEAIGVKVNGEYRQLNANILQIENEFYGTIRPKRTTRSGQRPSKALRENGVEYIEIRSLDLNPFSPVGITQAQIAFLDSFLLMCLFAPSLPITLREMGEIRENFRAVVSKGRHPDLTLILQNRPKSMREITLGLLSEMAKTAEFLDGVYTSEIHQKVIRELQEQVYQPETTLSGQILEAVSQGGEGFFGYALSLAKQTKSLMVRNPLDPELERHFMALAERSFADKADIEANSTGTFEDYLNAYFV